MVKMSSLINYLLDCLQIDVAHCESDWQLFILTVYQLLLRQHLYIYQYREPRIQFRANQSVT